MINKTVCLKSFLYDERINIIKIYTRLGWNPERINHDTWILTIPEDEIDLFTLLEDSDLA